ncbi:hypothetical protein Goarm_023351 [Gossypium armourianum]|uniref:Uncharacterized protein n=1 Tax=Gossypium armourianum TaxID=34283 RepID=A0A7J9KES1_9ROSI|nr:hypothetical protein [Gossypium armourianum]
MCAAYFSMVPQSLLES